MPENPMIANAPYTPPEFEKTAFNCPFCHAFSAQSWSDAAFVAKGWTIDDYHFCHCDCCRCFSLWVGGKLEYPVVVTAPPPNADLPEDIEKDFEEARRIASQSPRGAAALLRLCIQKICKELGEPGENLNADIGSLVRKGLSEVIRQSLDIVRVIGNESVHPGTLNLRDDTETATVLFDLVNEIAEDRISRPKRTQEIYDRLPESKRKAIENRDGK